VLTLLLPAIEPHMVDYQSSVAIAPSTTPNGTGVVILYTTLLLQGVHMIGRSKRRPGGEKMKSWKKLALTAFLLTTMGGTTLIA